MILEILRNTLSNNRIKQLVGNNIYLIHKPEDIKSNTYIEYHVVRESYNDFSGNANKSIDYNLQVSIFTKGDFTEIERVVKEVMELNNFRYDYGAHLYEDDVSFFHCAMRFKYKLIK